MPKTEFFKKLYKLAGERRETMIKNAQKLYETMASPELFTFAEPVGGGNFFGGIAQAPKKLTPAQKESFVAAMLDGEAVGKERDIMKHALAVAAAAEIPYEEVKFEDERSNKVHKLMAFNEDGVNLNLSERKEFNRQCQLIKDWVNDHVYDLEFPCLPTGDSQCWDVVMNSSVSVAKKSTTYEFLEDMRKIVDRLLTNTAGKYTVTLPYAQPHGRDNHRIEFASRKKIKITVGTQAAAQALQSYWRRFGEVTNSKISSVPAKTR